MRINGIIEQWKSYEQGQTSNETGAKVIHRLSVRLWIEKVVRPFRGDKPSNHAVCKRIARTDVLSQNGG